MNADAVKVMNNGTLEPINAGIAQKAGLITTGARETGSRGNGKTLTAQHNG